MERDKRIKIKWMKDSFRFMSNFMAVLEWHNFILFVCSEKIIFNKYIKILTSFANHKFTHHLISIYFTQLLYLTNIIYAYCTFKHNAVIFEFVLHELSILFCKPSLFVWE